MNLLLSNIMLALVWSLTIGGLTPANFTVGLVIGYAVLYVAAPRDRRGGYFGKVWKVLSLVVFTVVELVKANIRMAYYTVTPLHKLRPAILGVPIPEMSDLEITFLANLLTLTPGTLSLDVSADRRMLYVHFMHVEDPELEKRVIVEGFGRRLLEVTR